MHIDVQVSVWVPAFSSFRYIPKIWIAGSCANSMFNFLMSHHTIFHRNCIIWQCRHSHYQHTSVSMSLVSHQNLLFFLFSLLIANILMGIKWYLIVVLIWMSLMHSNIEHLYICLLAIHISSLEKFYLSFACFWIGLFDFCCWVERVPYIFWILILYHIFHLQIFSPIL